MRRVRLTDLESQSDHDLVKAFVDDGDADSLEVLLRRHQDRVYGLAFRTLGNRADALDATQDAFLNVFRKVGQWRANSAFTTWLYRTTLNACYDFSRRRSRAPVPTADVLRSQADLQSSVEDRVAVEQALAQLSFEHRTVLVLREIEGLSYDQIAEILDVPSGTVKSRIARARSALVNELGGAEEPDQRRNRLRGIEP